MRAQSPQTRHCFCPPVYALVSLHVCSPRADGSCVADIVLVATLRVRVTCGTAWYSVATLRRTCKSTCAVSSTSCQPHAHTERACELVRAALLRWRGCSAVRVHKPQPQCYHTAVEHGSVRCVNRLGPHRPRSIASYGRGGPCFCITRRPFDASALALRRGEPRLGLRASSSYKSVQPTCRLGFASRMAHG